jgi:hypothetical protein
MKVKVKNLDERLTVDFATFCCHALDIKPRVLYIDAYDELADGLLGYCLDVDVDKGIYSIVVSTGDRNITEIYKTIAHEIVHVKQYMLQDLGNLIEMKGYDYKSVWWEEEANKKSDELVKKYVDILIEMV